MLIQIMYPNKQTNEEKHNKEVYVLFMKKYTCSLKGGKRRR